MTQPAQGDVVQLNDDGTLNQVIATNIPNAYGIAADPLTGHLFVSELGGAIVEIDPVAKTSSVFASVSADGLAFDRITNTLYAALSSTTGGANNEIQGFNATTKGVVFDSGPNSIPGGPAGIAAGEGVLAGNLVVNANAGTLIELNLTTKAQTTIASGGTRGDLVTVDPNNGQRLVSQSDELAYLFAPDGGDFLADQAAVGNVVQGNFIGVDKSGQELGPTDVPAVEIGDSSGNLIGGPSPGAGNTMAFGYDGVRLDSGRDNAIESNSIHDMGAIGIDIFGVRENSFGVTANAPGGPHPGDPNDSQNYPVLTSASFDSASGITTIQGTLNSTPNSTFRIEFFASPQADPSGHGLAQTFLGALSAASPNPVTTDSNGNATFTFTTTAGNLAGQSISATATDPEGNTSEFAADVVVSGGTTTAPDLALSGNAPASVTLGQNVTDTLKVTDNGTASATGVTLTDTLPAGVTFISATGGVTPVNGVLTFQIGSLTAGASSTVTVVLKPTASGALSDQASASFNGTDPTPSDNALTLSTSVSAVTAPDLALSGNAPAAVTLGQNVTDTLKVANDGTASATGVTLTDTLPRGVSFVSATGGVAPVNGILTFDIGSLAAGASASFTIVATPAAAESITDRAAVTMSQNDPTPADNAVSLASVVKTASSSPGPVVTGVHRLGFHAQPTRIVLSFNEPLDAATAQNPANYQIVALGPMGSRSGSDPTVRITQAVYDAGAGTVTLIPAERLNLHDLFRLTVVGTGPGGVADTSGNLLDGDGSGDAGTSYVTIVSARNLVMTTTNPSIVAKYHRIVSHQAPFLRAAFPRGGAIRTA